MLLKKQHNQNVAVNGKFYATLGLTYRNDVLDFITDKFIIEFGSIDKAKNIGLTVARKIS